MDIGRCACARKVASLGTILSRIDGYRAVRMREKSCFSRCDFIAYGWISGGAHAREKLPDYGRQIRTCRAIRSRQRSSFSHLRYNWLSDKGALRNFKVLDLDLEARRGISNGEHVESIRRFLAGGN